MNRNILIKAHLIFTSFMLPFLILMPLTGFLYLIGEKGSQKTEFAFAVPLPEGEINESFFKNIFKEKDLKFNFEYIKKNGNSHDFRPSSREYYSAKVESDRIDFYKITPNVLKKLGELHKGHGPRLFKSLEIIFGITLLGIAFSGVLIAILVPTYRKFLVISAGAGVLVFVLALIL